MNFHLDFMLCVPVIECGLINHGRTDMHAKLVSFKDFIRKDCCFVTTWIKSKGLQSLFPVFFLDLSADLVLEVVAGVGDVEASN